MDKPWPEIVAEVESLTGDTQRRPVCAECRFYDYGYNHPRCVSPRLGPDVPSYNPLSGRAYCSQANANGDCKLFEEANIIDKIRPLTPVVSGLGLGLVLAAFSVLIASGVFWLMVNYIDPPAIPETPWQESRSIKWTKQ